MTLMTAVYFGNKQVGLNQLNSMILEEDTGTAAYLSGAQGGLPKISTFIYKSKKHNRRRTDANVHTSHTIWLR
jgi:hypothetical protein